LDHKDIIEISNLHFHYPDGTKALRRIDLTLREGDNLAIVGHNGAGKSTFVKHLVGVLYGHGSIRVDGITLCRKNIKQIRSLIGMVFQNPEDQLFCPTVYEDIAFGLVNNSYPTKDIPDRVTQTLKMVGMEEFAHKAAYHLSGGQRKRVAIATALCLNPKILILDEPTANLDPYNELTLVNLLKKIPCTKIIISHDLPILYQLCNRAVVMAGGTIIEDYSMEEFKNDRPLIVEHGLDHTFKCHSCQSILQLKKGNPHQTSPGNVPG
jgi:energy-coupling factor transporter ATP-binding protein EcfA2